MLSGSLPFVGKDDSKIIVSIQNAELNFRSQAIWQTISPDAIDLIKRMINRNIKNRLSAREVLNHHWIRSHAKFEVSDKNLLKSTLRNLSYFSSSSKFQRTVLCFIVNQIMTNEKIYHLEEIFLALDTDGDGILSKNELNSVMNMFSGESSNSIEKILTKIDEDRNGYISYSEFLTAAVNWKKELSRSLIHSAFRDFDLYANGKVTVNELTDRLGGTREQRHLFVEMMREAKSTNDGEIDLEEFATFMESVKILKDYR